MPIKNNQTVLITCPHPHVEGGVTNYFAALKKHYSVDVELFFLGSRSSRETVPDKMRNLLADINSFRKRLAERKEQLGVIHINPSFKYAALLRDGLNLGIAKRRNYRVVVLIHGWSPRFMRFVDRYFRGPFFHMYNQADAFIVLAEEFRDIFRKWGFQQPIYLETTPVDDSLLDGFKIEEKLQRYNSDKCMNILFLSRIEKEKGIGESIETLRLLLQSGRNVRLIVAGDGSYMSHAKRIAKAGGVADRVDFLGFIKGEQKKESFMMSDLYLFPSYSEGMPTSVLEAMGFGLPVVTRPVGGLKDFFFDGQFGHITERKDPEYLAHLVDRILFNQEVWKGMSSAAHEYARAHFMASQVAKRIEKIYTDITD
jgi:glycosyltransferase involved in cell wall biosynthesis